jgi:hypothetical protein
MPRSFFGLTWSNLLCIYWPAMRNCLYGRILKEVATEKRAGGPELRLAHFHSLGVASARLARVKATICDAWERSKRRFPSLSVAFRRFAPGKFFCREHGCRESRCGIGAGRRSAFFRLIPAYSGLFRLLPASSAFFRGGGKRREWRMEDGWKENIEHPTQNILFRGQKEGAGPPLSAFCTGKLFSSAERGMVGTPGRKCGFLPKAASVCGGKHGYYHIFSRLIAFYQIRGKKFW